MKAWEIWSYQPEGWPEPHPVVIVSAPGRVANKPELNVIMCSSKKAQRDPGPHQVILDSSDGSSRPTICKCDLFYLVTASDLSKRRGTVTGERRRQIIATMIRANGWVV
jgi:hypothetical protein